MLKAPRVVTVALIFLGVAGCSISAKRQNKKSGGDVGSAPATAAADSCPKLALSCPTKAGADGDDGSAKLGLADSCTYEKSDKTGGKSCFTCTPRDLPIVQCADDSPAAFDPTAACHHDADKMTCDLGGKTPFVFDFTQKSKLETVYDQLPLFSFAAKALLDSKFKGKPDQQGVVDSMFDMLDKYRKDIFSGADPAPMLDEMMALLKKSNAKLPDDQLKLIRTGAEGAIAEFQARRYGTDLAPSDMLLFCVNFMQGLPPDMLAKLTGQLDAGQAACNLQSSGDSDSLTTLLLSLGGGATKDDMLTALLSGSALTSSCDQSSASPGPTPDPVSPSPAADPASPSQTPAPASPGPTPDPVTPSPAPTP